MESKPRPDATENTEKLWEGTDRFEMEVDTTHVRDLWEEEVADNLASREASR